MTDTTQAVESGLVPEAPVQPAAAETLAPVQDGNPAEQQQEAAQQRTFTQAELDVQIAKRVAKERRRFEREMRAMIQPQQQPQQPASDEPKREQFQDYESYLDARSDHRARAAAAEHVNRVIAERAQATAAADLSMSAQEVIERGRTEFRDFDDVINSAFESGVIEAGGAVHRSLLQSDDGHKLAYHLATHPQEAARMAQLPPAQQLMALGRLSAKLEKPVSSAPPPPKPLNGGSAPVEKDFTEMSVREHMKWRQQRRKGL